MDADGNIWAVVPVKETPPRSNVWQGCWLQARAGNWRSRCSRTFSRPLLACPNWPASSRSPSTPTLPTSLCAPASRHGARRIAMVTSARSWPRTCRSRTAKKFEIDKPGMHTTDTVDYGIVPDARSGWSSTTASKSSSAARRGRPERHSPCVAKQERQARQDGFRADRGAAQCVADWVGLGAWNVGNPWLGRVFARRGERWLTRSFV